MISNVNFGSSQTDDPRVKQNYPSSVYYYPTRPVGRDEVKISNPNSQTNATPPNQYPQQRPNVNYPQRGQYPPAGAYRNRKKEHKPTMQTVGTILGMGASIAIIAALAGPQIASMKFNKNAEKFFTTVGDDIPNIDDLKSVNKNVKDFLKRVIDSSNVPNEIREKAGRPIGDRSILLYGPPGTGKSFFAKVAAKSMDAQYTEIDFSQIASPYIGQASKNIRDKADGIIHLASKSPNKKFVVTFNEIDALIQEDPQGASHTAEVRSTMLNILEQLQNLPNVLIVGTTNRNPKGVKLDKASVDRFQAMFEIPLPDKNCLKEALKMKLSKIEGADQFMKDNDSAIDSLTSNLETREYSHRKLDQLVEKTKTLFMVDKVKNNDVKFNIDYLNKVVDEMGDCADNAAESYFQKVGSEIPTIDNLKSINEDAKMFLKRIIDSANVSNEIWNDAGRPKGERSILLHGKPGTGKSFFAKVAAKSMDAKYAEIDFSQVASPYVGEESKNIRAQANAIMDLAKKEPKQKFVVTFNEIDSLIQKDVDGKAYMAERRSSMLNVLEQLQELPNVLIVGTTNKPPVLLDAASVDRFPTVFEIPLPDKKCLIEALKAKLSKVPAAEKVMSKNQKEIESFTDELQKKGYSHRKLDQ